VWLSWPRPFNGNFTIFARIRIFAQRTQGDAFAIKAVEERLRCEEASLYADPNELTARM
jgi:hypothetical protein